jgi:hypothetical protein
MLSFAKGRMKGKTGKKSLHLFFPGCIAYGSITPEGTGTQDQRPRPTQKADAVAFWNKPFFISVQTFRRFGAGTDRC